MESMNLGTPNNSGPSSPATTPTGSPYLPAFLLGEPQTPVAGSTSPKSKRVHFGDSHNASKDHHAKHDYSMANYFLSQIVNNSGSLNSSMQYNTTEKNSGPPILGLFDTINSPPLGNESQSNDVQKYVSFASKHYAETRTSPVKSVDMAESNWVTVFGYPPSAASFILSQLSHCGNIIATRSPAKGNWMHIQYSSKLEARRALANNGKVFASTVMIGVIPCRDQGIMMECATNKENFNASFQTFPATPYMSTQHPRNRLYPDLNGSLGGPSFNETSIYESPISSPARHINARPLQSRLGDTEVYSGGNNPQKNTGLVAKAMEYVFGCFVDPFHRDSTYIKGLRQGWATAGLGATSSKRRPRKTRRTAICPPLIYEVLITHCIEASTRTKLVMFVGNGSAFVRDLAMGSYICVGHTKSASLPPFSTSVLSPEDEEWRKVTVVLISRREP